MGQAESARGPISSNSEVVLSGETGEERKTEPDKPHAQSMKLLRSSRSSDKETNELTQSQSGRSTIQPIAPIRDKRLSMIQDEFNAVRPSTTKFKSSFFDNKFDGSSADEEEKRRNFAFNSVTEVTNSKDNLRGSQEYLREFTGRGSVPEIDEQFEETEGNEATPRHSQEKEKETTPTPRDADGNTVYTKTTPLTSSANASPNRTPNGSKSRSRNASPSAR